MNQQRILFVINPISGTGRKKIIEKLLPLHLDKSVFDSHIKYTSYAGHAAEISKAEAPNYDIIVAVGGDGTVNEVARGLVGTATAMAVIPAGSGNGFARYFGIPRNFAKAIQLINRRRTQTIDTFMANNTLIVNVGGVGFDAHVAHLFDKYSFRGFWAYFVLVTKSFFGYRAQQYQLQIDKETVEVKALLVSFANTSQFGFNAHIAPSAIASDGFMNITIIKRIALYQIPMLVFRLFGRKLKPNRDIAMYTAGELTISQQMNEIEGHADGEAVLYSNPIRVSIRPQSLRIVY